MSSTKKESPSFKPYVPADRVLPEITLTSVLLGVILAVVFGAANAYLGLRVGMTVSASIPAAVISMGFIRKILKHNSILENNMVQTIGSAGESLAAGAIFTLPAVFMWAQEYPDAKGLSFLGITLITLAGGLLGVCFMVPLRTALIVEEHGVLPFPEGQACAEVLLAGEEGGSKSTLVFSGLGIAAVYKFIADGIRLFPSEVHWEIPALRTGFGADVLPALVGVGYICGQSVAKYMFAGGIFGWLVLIPLLALFGGDAVLAPGTVPISSLDSFGIWNHYLRYIGAGAVAAGGIISLIKTMPTIVKTFRQALGGIGHKEAAVTRTNRDLSLHVVYAGVLVLALLIWLIPAIPIPLAGAIITVVLGFFFSAVTSRMVGLVGTSNNPVSGMAIATLLISTTLLKALGYRGAAGMTSAICIGTIICIISAMAGDMSQDLKTGYIVGATPIRQQYGEIIGSIAAAIAIGGIMYLLNAAWGFGSAELPAPQATLMKLVVEGVMGGTLPWALVFAGAGTAIVFEIFGLPVLAAAIGLYLPVHLTVPIIAGGLIRKMVEQRKDDPEAIERGILFSSGLIAGEGLVGILLAVFAVIPLGSGSVGDAINLGGLLGNAGGLVFFVLLLISLVFFTRDGKKGQTHA